MKTKLSSFIDAARWIAALFVVIAHTRQIILVDYVNVVNKNIFVKGLYFLTGLGHLAVMVFFVISGLLVGGGLINKWSDFNYKKYYLNRFSRIYTVLIPALILGGFVDWIGYSYFNHSNLYNDLAKYSMIPSGSSAPSSISISTFIGNLFMLQDIIVPNFGSNSPLWSLSNEWWYYCIFPLLTTAILNRGIATKLFTFVAITTFFLVSPSKFYYMAIWLLGVGVFLYDRSELPKPSPLIGIFAVLFSLIASRTSSNAMNILNLEPYWYSFAKDFAFSFSFSILLVSMHSNKQGSLIFSSLHKVMADFSFSIYLTHFPLLIFAIAVAKDTLGISFSRQPSLVSICYLISMVIMLYMAGYYFSLLSEKQTYQIRSKLNSLCKKLLT